MKKDEIILLWPEVNLIKDLSLKEKVIECWKYALENSELTAQDLHEIPFSLLIKDCNISFINHKRTCVQLAVDIAGRMKENFGDAINIDMDILIAGAILIDVGKLFEYTKKDGKLGTSKAGSLLRHPFSGVAIADRFGLPPEVLHIIAYHSKEGDLGKRSVEAIIVHHADFVSFEPFKN
ncbi:HD domain-containing protein [Melioribacter sp. Ez-97]|uniref:HD domain-containing protein n=1 Tax=Melioribacter sp. Ez-97 TaxID=3423434 RepID=UPI003ED9904D